MSSRAVTDLTEDQALPALAQALDTNLMLPFLVQAVGLHLEDTKGIVCSAEVLKHKLGQRCTIRYLLAHASYPRGPMDARAVIGKLYGRRCLADQACRRTQALRSRLFNNCGPLCIPAPIMLLSDLGLMLQEHVEGADLRYALAAGNSNGPLALAAQWLARLHTAPPLAGLKTKSLEHELQNVDRWCEETAPYLMAADVQRLRRAQDTLHRLAGEMPPSMPVMIHRDFYYANVLWDGQRVWVLDFDQFSLGDPALDVGHFLAHLQSLAYRTTGEAHAFAEPAVFFLKSYLERNSIDLHLGVLFYKAYTFLKLAATEASRRRGQWERLIHVLTSLACQEVDPPLGNA